MHPEAGEAPVRKLRKTIELALPMVGVALVLFAVIVFGNIYVQIAVVLLGLILIEAGIWNLANPILPSERKFLALRTEVDDFIAMVRRLNSASLMLASDPSPENRARVLSVRDDMLESVRRMELYAGKTDDELTAAPSQTPDESAEPA